MEACLPRPRIPPEDISFGHFPTRRPWLISPLFTFPVRNLGFFSRVSPQIRPHSPELSIPTPFPIAQPLPRAHRSLFFFELLPAVLDRASGPSIFFPRLKALTVDKMASRHRPLFINTALRSWYRATICSTFYPFARDPLSSFIPWIEEGQTCPPATEFLFPNRPAPSSLNPKCN